MLFDDRQKKSQGVPRLAACAAGLLFFSRVTSRVRSPRGICYVQRPAPLVLYLFSGQTELTPSYLTCCHNVWLCHRSVEVNNR
jgi:hypothetical protein